LSLEGLVTKAQEKRAYSVLTFLAHGYCYGVPNSDEPIDILPKSISLPWYQVSERLKIHPVASLSGLALWNWYMLDPSKPFSLKYITLTQ
jgi:indoleamine 2,3-dioxygenase